MHEELFKECYEKDRDDVLSLYDYYAGFTSGCEAIINKACEWLKEHKNDYAFPIYQAEELTDESFVSDSIIKDFRKAMEE